MKKNLFLIICLLAVDVLKKNKILFEDVAGKKNVISLRVDGIKQLWLQDPDGYWIEINDAKF